MPVVGSEIIGEETKALCRKRPHIFGEVPGKLFKVG